MRTRPLLLGVAALLLMAIAPAVASAQTIDEGTSRILKAMVDYIAGQKTISFAYETDTEVVTTQMQKLQFASSGTVLIERPGKIRATRTGGYADVELISDGKTVGLYGKNEHVYAQSDAPPTLGKLIDQLRDDLDVAMPAGDLLSAQGLDDLTIDVVEGRHIGRGVVNGVECEHLAFRTHDVDWQIWIAAAGPPIPHKYVITSKSVSGSPDYSLLIKDWKTNVAVAADAFAVKEPPEFKKVAARDLKNLDEIPPGRTAPATTGGTK